jgi:hypothetical protein
MSLTLNRCLVILLFLGAHPHVLAACEPIGTPSLTLSVTTPMVSIADRTLSVQVYDNGCVTLHRPSYYRLAGDFRVALTPVELAALKLVATPERVRQIDRAALVSSANVRSSSTRTEVLQDVDADLFVLEAGAGAAATKLSALGVVAGAAAQPDNADLQALNTMVQALLALDARVDAVQVVGGAK